MYQSDLHMFLHLNRQLQKIYERMFQDIRQSYQFTQNEIDVLLFLSNHKEKNTAMDIVKDRAISKSLISKSVDSLIKKGFLEAKSDKKDRRYTRLYITPQAGHIMIMLHGIQNKFFQLINQNMSDEEKQVMAAFVNRFSKELEDYIQ